MSRKVEYRVQTTRNYRNGEFLPEWRVNKVTSGDDKATTSQPFADVFGKRADALKVARLMTQSVTK